MKKIKLLFGFFLIFLLNINFVYAYEQVEDYKFENYMKEHDYEVFILEDGPNAKKRYEVGEKYEEYQYRSFDDNQSALLYLKDSYQDFEESSLEHHFEESYNVMEDKNDDYSYFAVNGDFLNFGSQYYYYIFRYQNVVIYGSCDYEYHENVKNNIQNLFNDTKIEKKENTTIFLSLKNMVVNNFRSIIFSFVSITFFLIVITFCIFKIEAKKK